MADCSAPERASSFELFVGRQASFSFVRGDLPAAQPTQTPGRLADRDLGQRASATRHVTTVTAIIRADVACAKEIPQKTEELHRQGRAALVGGFVRHGGDTAAVHDSTAGKARRALKIRRPVRFARENRPITLPNTQHFAFLDRKPHPECGLPRFLVLGNGPKNTQHFASHATLAVATAAKRWVTVGCLPNTIRGGPPRF
jgi:hypothetical protein